MQKCVRTLDIEEVGKTTRHGTFFQMNGNFSFGDYFKDKAIESAWDLVTRSQNDGGYGFDGQSGCTPCTTTTTRRSTSGSGSPACPTTGSSPLGMKDNYWSMGIPGPGGPCSRSLIDRGPEYGADRGLGGEGDRYLEFWNLVFMQNDLVRVAARTATTILGELPKKNIDTGLGLERVAYLLQGVDNMYEIDEIYPVIERRRS